MWRFLTIALIFVSLSLVSTGNALEVTTSKFVLSVKDDNPQYDFSVSNSSNSKYMVKLSELYEEVDGKKVGGSNVALNSLDWLVTSSTSKLGSAFELEFNLTAKDSGHGNGNDAFKSLTLVNHLKTCANASQTNTTNNNGTSNSDTCNAGSLALKFDIILEGYNWKSERKDAKLSLVFMLHATGGGALSPVSTSGGVSTVKFGDDAYYNAATKATTSNGTDIGVNVSVSGNKVTLSYDWFPSSMKHDPGFGFTKKSSGHGMPIWELGAIVASTAICGCTLLIFITAVVVGMVTFNGMFHVLLSMRRNNGYDSINA